MSQNVVEIAKEITIAAIQSGAFTRISRIDMNAEDMNKANAQDIGKFYKEIAKNINDAFNGRY